MMAMTWLLFAIALLVVGEQGIVAQLDSDDEKNAVPIRVHAWLMWSSFGFLFPLGVILIRYNRSQSDPTAVVSPARAKIFRYVHSIVQCSAVVLAAAGVFTIDREVGSKFNRTHGRLGWSILIIVMVMPLIGIVRPLKGKPWRKHWYFVHWLLGTGAVVLGFVDMYIGIWMYQFEGQWSYILSQGSENGLQSGEQQLEGKKSPMRSVKAGEQDVESSPKTSETV